MNPTTAANLPTIDLQPSFNGSEAERREVARAIWSALSEQGFFYIRNHGVPDELLARTRCLFSDFYAQPREEKRGIQGHAMRGYTGFLELGVGGAVAEQAYALNDLCERLTYGREVTAQERAEDPYYQTPLAATMIPPNPWPPNADSTGFKGTVVEYFQAMERLFHHLMSLIAIAAELPGDFWKPFFTKSCTALSGINYPEPPAELFQPGVERLKAHADFNVLTLLQHENPPNGCSHLEVEVDGQWRGVPARQGSFIVNIGEVLQIVTNGRLKATKHRVVMPERREGSQRLSLVFFCNPNHDAVFDVLASCLGVGEAPRRLDYQQYLTDIFARMRGHQSAA
jgi:isopenicillin N synthase-like dioxygenase